jgi:peroxiredoxin
MKRAWIRYNEYDIRSEGSLAVGDLAPDLELAAADGSGTTRISDLYREKPLVLVFGSYT